MDTVFSKDYVLSHDKTLIIPEGITVEFADGIVTEFNGTIEVYGTLILHNTTWQDFINLKDGIFHFYKGSNLYIDDVRVLGTMGDYSSQILLGNTTWEATLEENPVLSVTAEDVFVSGKVYLNATISDVRPWSLGEDSAVVLYADNCIWFTTSENSLANIYTYGGLNTNKRCYFDRFNYQYSYNGEEWSSFTYADLANIENLLNLAGYYIRQGEKINEYRGGLPVWNGEEITEDYESCVGEDGQIIKDIQYAEREGTRNTYDLWLPDYIANGNQLGKDVPVIVFLHGGSWTSGEKESMAALCAMYTQLGYVTATVNYRLANKELAEIDNGDFFDMRQDVYDVVTSIRKELESRGYTSSGMAISGQSAGGYIAMFYAATYGDSSPIPVKLVLDEYGPTDFSPEAWANDRLIWSADKWTEWAKEYEVLYDDPNWADKMVNAAGFVAGMLEINGYDRSTEEDILRDYQDEASEIFQQIKSISPVLLWDEYKIPCVAIHGEMDPIVSVVNAQNLKTQLDKLGVDSYIIITPVNSHANGEDVTAYVDYYSKSLEYLKKYLPSSE